MKSRSTFLAVISVSLLCAALLAGCSDPRAAAAGTYELDKAAIKAAAEAEIKAKGDAQDDPMGAQMMLGMIDAMSITMTLNADGTATMQSSMMGQTETATGTWTISGKSITLTASSAGETPQPLTGTIDGDILTMKPPQEEEAPFDMVFKKKKT